jgi:hypothetical protein
MALSRVSVKPAIHAQPAIDGGFTPFPQREYFDRRTILHYCKQLRDIDVLAIMTKDVVRIEVR